jgi:hypothetical protein
MRFFDFFKRLFFRRKGTLALLAAGIALSFAIKGHLSDKSDEIQKEIVSKKAQVQLLEKRKVERPFDKPDVSEGKDTFSGLRKQIKDLEEIKKTIASKEKQVALKIKQLEAEPLNQREEVDFDGIEEQNQRVKQHVEIALTIAKLSLDEKSDLLYSVDSSHARRKIAPELMAKFSSDIEEYELIKFVSELNDTHPKFLFGESVRAIKVSVAGKIAKINAEHKRLKKYFDINDQLFELMNEGPLKGQLKKDAEKMNQLNQNLAYALIRLENLRDSLSATLVPLS